MVLFTTIPIIHVMWKIVNLIVTLDMIENLFTDCLHPHAIWEGGTSFLPWKMDQWKQYVEK